MKEIFSKHFRSIPNFGTSFLQLNKKNTYRFLFHCILSAFFLFSCNFKKNNLQVKMLLNLPSNEIVPVLSSSKNLLNLTTSSGTLYPAFSSTTTSYLVTLSNNTTSITVTPTLEDTNSTVKINGIVSNSGSPSPSISLNVGSNTITVEVISPDNTSQTYTINAFVVTDYLVKVNVSGLNGTLVVSNLSDSLNLTTNGTFAFPSSIANGSSYSVAIASKPSSQFCAITSAPNNNLPYGNISSADVTMNIQCNDGYLYNGTIYSTFPIPSIPTLNQLTTMAGAYPVKTPGSTNGVGTIARFNHPIAIATDGTFIYVADIFNSAIRKLEISTNTVTTIASSTGPHGIATDGIYVYFTSHNTHTIRRVSITGGTVQILAGTSGTSGNLNGLGTNSKFNTPTYLTTDGKNIYITDRGNNQIRRYTIATGIVTTLVSGLNYPNGITTDGFFLYIANSNSNNILKYDLNAGGSATVFATGLTNPYGLTMDGSSLYVFEGSGKSIKKISLSNPASVTTILSSVGYTDGNLTTTAQICIAGSNCDSSLTTDGVFLYVADRHNHSIRKIGP